MPARKRANTATETKSADDGAQEAARQAEVRRMVDHLLGVLRAGPKPSPGRRSDRRRAN